MQKNWKHVLPFALTTLVALTSVARADADNAQMRNLENRVSALEQRKGAGGMINPQGRPQVRDGVDLFIFGDLLYWNAHENGLDIAVKQSDNSVGFTETLNDATVKNLHGKWNWGFRTGLGYNTMHDGWDISLTWLRYTDTGRHHPKGNASTAFYPTQTAAELTGTTGFRQYATDVSGYWGMNLNQLDLDMGREFFVSKWLTVRPHVGLRTDWIHQNFHVKYYGLNRNNTDGLPNDVLATMKDHWWGLGLEGGLDTQWGIGGGWSVFGNLAASILYGLHDIKTENEFLTIGQHNDVDYSDVRKSYHISHPVLDMALGIRWDYLFSNDRFHIGFDLGWEHHVYFSQNQFPLFVDDTTPGMMVANQGDLTLQGWTFSARFDF
jgi:hypothetical protein